MTIKGLNRRKQDARVLLLLLIICTTLGYCVNHQQHYNPLLKNKCDDLVPTYDSSWKLARDTNK